MPAIYVGSRSPGDLFAGASCKLSVSLFKIGDRQYFALICDDILTAGISLLLKQQQFPCVRNRDVSFTAEESRLTAWKCCRKGVLDLRIGTVAVYSTYYSKVPDHEYNNMNIRRVEIAVYVCQRSVGAVGDFTTTSSSPLF